MTDCAGPKPRRRSPFPLNLHTNDLSGDIPSALGRLTRLTRLRIGGVDGNPGNTNSP